jgi:hypothetical protein
MFLYRNTNHYGDITYEYCATQKLYCLPNKNNVNQNITCCWSKWAKTNSRIGHIYGVKFV